MLASIKVYHLKNLVSFMGAAMGGPVQYKANGFGITDLLDADYLKEFEELQAMIARMSGRQLLV
jgi:hypothetical protein